MPATTGRRLVLLRHGKAEPFAVTDIDRPLTERGRRTCIEAGRRLAVTGVVPDHAVVSSSVRTRATWEATLEGLAREGSAMSAAPGAPVGSAVDVDINADVYDGSVQLLTEVLRSVPPQVATVIIVGHNPTLTFLAHEVDNGDGDPEATAALLRGLSPGALAVFSVDCDWADVGHETGRLLDFYCD